MTLISVICFSLRNIYIYLYALYLDCLLNWNLWRDWKWWREVVGSFIHLFNRRIESYNHLVWVAQKSIQCVFAEKVEHLAKGVWWNTLASHALHKSTPIPQLHVRQMRRQWNLKKQYYSLPLEVHNFLLDYHARFWYWCSIGKSRIAGVE